MANGSKDNNSNEEKKGEYLFRLASSWILLILGAIFIVHNLFNQPIGSELIFGLEFIGGAYYISQRKFKGFKP